MGRSKPKIVRPDFLHEDEIRAQGYRAIAGVDEVGRGAWAGPLVAAAVVLPPYLSQEVKDSIDDSKRLTAAQREDAYDLLVANAESFGVGIVQPERIDLLGIVPATKEAMRRAIRANRPNPDFLLVDAVSNLGIATRARSIVRGDSASLSIAAASIVAKVTRDRILSGELADTYPEFGFDRHKGYGTAMHANALSQFGPTPIHRRSFKPVARAIAERSWSATGETSPTNIDGESRIKLPDGLGKSGEISAARYLERLGYRIIGRNYKTRQGEVDLIAEEKGVLVFAEVKTRTSAIFGSLMETITGAKLRRIEKVAMSYLASKFGRDDIDWRIDVVGVNQGRSGSNPRFELVRNAHYG